MRKKSVLFFVVFSLVIGFFIYQWQKPIITKEEAIGIAMKHIKSERYSYKVDKAEFEDKFFNPVYRITLTGTHSEFYDKHWITIDAYSGEIIVSMVSG